MSVNQVCQAYEFFSSVLTVERVAGVLSRARTACSESPSPEIC